MRVLILLCLVAAAAAGRDYYDYDYDEDYSQSRKGSYGRNRKNMSKKRNRLSKRRSYDSYDYDYGSDHRRYGRMGGSDDYYDTYGDEYDEYDVSTDYYGGDNGKNIANGYMRTSRAQKSSGYHKPRKATTKYVPVVVKKKKQKKKSKIIAVHTGFFVPGGTQMFGKFQDLHSCKKACELTPTCFAGDYNPWVKKCFMHSNLTACTRMSSHKQITHFKKVPCQILASPRGLITLGAQVFKAIEQKGIDNLMDCIKKCTTLGGGIAPTDATIASTPMLCFGVDYDFATHKCFFHVTNYCGTVNPILTPAQQVKNPSSINILICPKST